MGKQTLYFIITIGILILTNTLALSQVREVRLQNDSSKTIKLPVIGISAGWSFLNGDVGNDGSGTGAIGQFGYALTIDQAIFPFLSLSLDIGTTKFYGEQKIDNTTNINYRSVVFTQDLKFQYEASHLFGKNKNGFQPIQPYFGFGVGLISFRAKGDLTDANGNTYNYWEDGTIRDLPETATNQDIATELQRDYNYETELRDANLDGFGRYNQMALHVPIEIGFRYQFTKHIGAHIKGLYNFNFTDLIDNVNELSTGSRQGDPGNDNHISAMVGLSIFLGNHHKQKHLYPPLQIIAEQGDTSTNNSISDRNQALQNEDLENEIELNSSENEEITEAVSTSGKNNVIEQGKTTGETHIDENYPQDSTNIKEKSDTANIKDSSKNENLSIIDLIDQTSGIETTKPKPSGMFHWADLNKNNYISPDEVLHFIDLLFEDDSEYTVPMIHGLIEYYFEQD